MSYEYPEGQATEIWEKDGVTFSLVESGHYCGYCRFSERPTIEDGYSNLLTYVPVHGGITYAREADDGTMVYGFDCAHCDDADNPFMQDVGWLKAECERMAIAILRAVGFEEGYLSASTDEDKAAVIDAYHAALKVDGLEFSLTDNFGAMINVVFGGL